MRQTFHVVSRFPGLVGEKLVRLHVLEIEQAAKLVSVSLFVGNGIYNAEVAL